MKVPRLKTVGMCSGKCKQEVEAAEGETHACEHLFGNQRCNGSHMSFSNARLVIQTIGEADTVARFLLEDRTICFAQPWADSHSMVCGDGRNCHELRAKLGRALAAYHISQRERLAASPTNAPNSLAPTD